MIKRGKIYAIIALLVVSTYLYACENETNKHVEEETIIVTDGSEGQYLYEGVTFLYTINENKGATITGVQPESGVELIIPKKIGDYDVVEYKKIDFKYKKITLDISKVKNNNSLDISAIERYKKKFGNELVKELNLYNVDEELKGTKIAISFPNVQVVRVIEEKEEIQIGENVFYELGDLETLEIENISSVGQNAFAGCTS